MNENSVDSIAKSLSTPGALPGQNFKSLLTAFSIFLQARLSARGSPFVKTTAAGYMSQVVNLLRARYLVHLSGSKRINNIRKTKGGTIEERNFVVGTQTGEAPGRKLSELRVLEQETTIKEVGSSPKRCLDQLY